MHDKEHSTLSTSATFHTFRVLSAEPESNHFGGSSLFVLGEKCKVLTVLKCRKSEINFFLNVRISITRPKLLPSMADIFEDLFSRIDVVKEYVVFGR